MIWLLNSFILVKVKFYFIGLKQNERPDGAFVARAFEQLRKRVALGGHRLADLVKLIKKSIDNPEPRRRPFMFLEEVEESF